ncbi:hypothetical protein FG386_002635 [Cryptosporidium ryanae]|uniref:uncharacterized protein n=1 Tax=Cryptosporidium ryanae TaxID=515981 RepID=UPI00351A8B2A|nr:hypothetical protein FG386_002635 [Cryptosporidium ryanae]
MSILIVNDIDLSECDSLNIIDSVSGLLRRLFSSDEFLKEYSEFLFSVYFAIDDEVKSSLFESSYFCELYWHPVSSSCLNFVYLYNKLFNYISKNTEVANYEIENQVIEINKDLKTHTKLKSIKELITGILMEDVLLEYSLYDNFRKISRKINRTPLDLESSIKKNDNLVIGKDRQLLIIWIVSSRKYITRKRLGDLQTYVELNESSIIPNVEIRYIVLEKIQRTNDHHGDGIIFIDLSNLRDTIYDSILGIINKFFYSEEHTIVFSPKSTLAEIGYFDDLSLMVSQLYPSITAFPIFIRDTCNNLSLPPFSTIVGVISFKKYQPLPIVTRRLIKLKNSSEGKKEAVKSLIISLYKNKLAIALELNEKWYGLLISITIGTSLHLAIDILKPGYIIAE